MPTRRADATRCPAQAASPQALAFGLVPSRPMRSSGCSLGRAMRSDRLHETLLPKRIALPVFASDALSSVAYAPHEIFLTLGIAGFAAYSYSWKVGIAVALVMLVVVASYRQNVHAYPSGGGDYEVATVNLGMTPGLTVASALLVDYVLTVAVSISSAAREPRVDRRRSLRATRSRSRSSRSSCSRRPTCAACASRAPRSPSRPTPSCSRSSAWRRSGSSGSPRGDLPDVESARFDPDRRAELRRRASPGWPAPSCCCGRSPRAVRR